ncbi:hypothetical protein [Stenomitos frigidus]|uniref:Uncharacterized protein n=1 Tax=Stenomitos frigidus ULC18 TaxID=2107698 RepID=A0A2T1EC53_9CYAN|nr:hypothetical protein [Stenomitos frigidus]PSB30263.1 hypothetical protein C7B82_09280 [Stenomitos frigidus ULC18]
MLALLAQQFGPQFVLPTINEMEPVDSHSYDAQADVRDTVLPVEERSHARLLEAIVGYGVPSIRAWGLYQEVLWYTAL